MKPDITLKATGPSFLRRILALVCSASFATLTAQAAESTRTFDVPAGEAGLTLKQFATQAQREIVFSPGNVAGLKTNPVQGDLAPSAALDLMLADTGLAATQDIKTGAFAVRKSALPNGPRAARVENRDRPESRSKAEEGKMNLDPYEVTGSRLRQTELEGPSPVISFDRAYLEASGFGTTEEFMRTLPQNFSGTSSAANGRTNVANDENPTLFVRSAGQSGVGLRGLGSNSTLVLIDGRRAPLSGKANISTTPPQSFFDINTIPFGMIERIEVLTDGASAIYGTDAISGVVNIILKKSATSAEVRTRIAGTFHGGGFERGATLSGGFAKGKLHTT